MTLPSDLHHLRQRHASGRQPSVGGRSSRVARRSPRASSPDRQPRTGIGPGEGGRTLWRTWGKPYGRRRVEVRSSGHGRARVLVVIGVVVATWGLVTAAMEVPGPRCLWRPTRGTGPRGPRRRAGVARRDSGGSACVPTAASVSPMRPRHPPATPPPRPDAGGHAPGSGRPGAAWWSCRSGREPRADPPAAPRARPHRGRRRPSR